MSEQEKDTRDRAFSLDDVRCIKCGGELDTGFECNNCDFDMLPYINKIPRMEEQPE